MCRRFDSVPHHEIALYELYGVIFLLINPQVVAQFGPTFYDLHKNVSFKSTVERCPMLS